MASSAYQPTYVEAEKDWRDFFVGRIQELTTMRSVLFKRGGRVVVLHGNRGQGRTALARRFADLHSDRLAQIGGPSRKFLQQFLSLPRKKRLDWISSLKPTGKAPLFIWDMETDLFDASLTSLLMRVRKDFPALKMIVVSNGPISLSIVDRNIEIAPPSSAEFKNIVEVRLGHAIDLGRFEAAFGAELREPHSDLNMQRRYELQRVAKFRERSDVNQHERSFFDPADTIRARLQVLYKNLDLLNNFNFSGLLGTDGHPMPPELQKKVIHDVRSVDSQLLSILNAKPELMRDLDPVQFESLIAELLHKQGYSITPTRTTLDGGVDLFAAKNDSTGRFLLLVQCKRYAEHRAVGVAVARELYGVVEEKRASAGLLVTSSHFSRSAKLFQQSVEHRLSLKDYLDLRLWLSQFASGS